MSLDPRFVIVRTAEGATVVVRKGEEKDAVVRAAARAPVRGAASESGPGAASGGGAAGGGGGGGAAGGAEGAARTYKPSTLPLDERVRLALSVGEECVQPDELRLLLEKKPFPVCYDGFEPSGRMHIAQGILKALYVNRLTAAGCVFKFWVADWFAMLNNKMDGDLKKIRVVGEYMVEVWKACGMDMTNVEFLWASDEINRRPDEYWSRVMEIARLNSLQRILRCTQIMGRSETDDLSAAQIMYPCMQAADIFFLKADICQLGMDQRKVNMLAREYCDSTRPKIKFKPVILSHHMMMGLKEGQEKMSKSIADSAIFMEDTPEDVARKIRSAFCPPGVIEANPCTEMVRYIVIPKFGRIELAEGGADGRGVSYDDADAFERDYVEGKVHPKALKDALAKAINACIEPVRQHFATDPKAAAILKQVRSFKTTR
jgi:tyrosyl-tRNA synthetase